MTVDTLGEHAVLARILSRLPRTPSSVLVGPGDDAAVVAPERNTHLVLTTDTVVEGVHFTRPAFSPADIGWKALAVNLSDLAAMGAEPRWALLSLALPGGWLVDDIEALVDGFVELARRHAVAVVGGNVTRTTGPLVVDATLGGSARPRRLLTRGGARPGDHVYVSGTIGGARAGLEMIGAAAGRRDAASSADDAAARACVARQLRPEPRVRLGLALARARAARAAMDLSDGLADALGQVAAQSGCGVRIHAEALPIEPGAAAWWRARGVDPVGAAVAGGEEYELLVAVPPRGAGRLRAARRHAADPPLVRIGEFTRQRGELVLSRGGVDEPLPAGFEHFGRH